MHWVLKIPDNDEALEPDKRFDQFFVNAPRLRTQEHETRSKKGDGIALRIVKLRQPSGRHSGFLLRSDVIAMIVVGFLSAERYHVHSHSYSH